VMASAAVASRGAYEASLRSRPEKEKDEDGGPGRVTRETRRRVSSREERPSKTIKRGRSYSDEEFVVVTVEEVELSVSSVVALDDEEGWDERSAECLEARVRATQQVALVHELALLDRAGAARALARKLSGQSDEADDRDDRRRKGELEAALSEAARGGCAAAAAQVSDPFVAASDDWRGVLGRSIRVCCREYLPEELASLSRRDESERQARRDIERDSLVVDDAVIEGGRVGYDSVVDRLARAGRQLVDRAGATDWRRVDDADLADMAKVALRFVNRTESGGLALAALQRLVAADLVPVPDSKSAEPLKIRLALRPARVAPGKWRWGLCAHLEGSTAYRLFKHDDFDHQVARARATYDNSVLLPLDALDDDPKLLYDRANAVVHLELSKAPNNEDDDDYAVVDN